jgi:hypothetical protein
MSFTRSGFRTCTIGAAFALFASAASPQTPVPLLHEHGSRPHAAPTADVAAKLASLDARIAILRVDMMMFVGEWKIQAMASLLDALIERQALTDRERHLIHDERRDPSDDQSVPLKPTEMEPEAMCSPFI